MKPGGIYSDPILLTQFLTLNGDGTGDFNAIGDYTTPDIFYIQPSVGEIMEIDKLLIYILDSGALPGGVYGGLGSALTNGINITVTNARSIDRSIIPGLIKANTDLVHLGNGGFSLTNFTGGVDAIVSSIDFTSITGSSLILDGDQVHKLEVKLSDSFIGLNDHRFIAHGRK